MSTPFQPIYAVGGPMPGAVEPSARLALVIGNDDYPGAPLENSGPGATHIAAALKKNGFTLIGDGGEQRNKNAAQMRDLFDQLERAAARTPGALVVVYFAGHGTISGSHNLLAPTDIGTAGEALLTRAISVADVAQRLNQARVGLTVMFLDDCRDSNRLNNDQLLPEDLPDNTFVGYSTRLGGMATEDNPRYTEALAAKLEHGFDTLANMHIDLISAVAVQVTHDGLIQLPVFSVGKTMPSRPILFYPPGVNGYQRTVSNPIKLDVSIERRCDEASVGGFASGYGELGHPPPYQSICQQAWDAGWRSNAVLRGHGLAGIVAGNSDYASFGYIFQAAEMGDASATEFTLIASACCDSTSSAKMLVNADPSVRRSQIEIDHFVAYLTRNGITTTGININNMQLIIDYFMIKLLSSDNNAISYHWASFEALEALGYPKFSLFGYDLYANPRVVELARQTMIRLAEAGYVPATFDLSARALFNETWTKELPIRTYVERAMNKYEKGDPINIVINPNLIDRLKGSISDSYGVLGFSRYNDLLSGRFGPPDPAAAVELGVRLEAKSPYLAVFTPTLRQNNALSSLGELLIVGKTNKGISVRRDIPTGLRLLRFAAARGVQQAQAFLSDFPWVTTTSGCLLWLPGVPVPLSSVTWSGQCDSGGAINGFGTVTLRTVNGTITEDTGTYSAGHPQDGRHVQVAPTGERWDGQMKEGNFDGQITVTWPDGQQYRGGWRNRRANGIGVYSQGGRHVEGLWNDGCLRQGPIPAAIGRPLADCH